MKASRESRGDHRRDMPPPLREGASKRPRSAYFRVTRPIYITDTLSIEESKQLRRMDKNEFFEVEEGPKRETSVGVDRVRGRALKDGSAGWVTMSANTGNSAPFMVPASADELANIAAT